MSNPVPNFRFEEPGRIARSALPESAAAVDWLESQGIRAVASLHPVPEEAAERIRALGIAWKPFPIEGGAFVVPGSLRELLSWIEERAALDPAVLIH